jgi:hypothetical protein
VDGFLPFKLDVGDVLITRSIIRGFHPGISSRRGMPRRIYFGNRLHRMSVGSWDNTRHSIRFGNWWKELGDHGSQSRHGNLSVIRAESMYGARAHRVGVGCPIGRKVRRIRAALREWHTHGLSKTVEGGKSGLALGATFNHL